MSLSPEQRRKLIAEANRRGIDVDKLLAAAEKRTAQKPDKPGPVIPKADQSTEETADEPGNLFMYLLPFVTVTLAARLANEPLTPALLLGAVLVVVGVWFGALARGKTS